MSSHLASTHKGNVSEILADFLLSLLGAANPVRRQFDDGYDFHCTLASEQSGLVTFDSPFTIQIKSGANFSVQYGKNATKWKSEDIEWLFKHQIPFFLGFINVKEKSLQIFDTTGLWFLFVTQKNACSQIIFKPQNRNNGERRELPKEKKIRSWTENKGDGIRYEIDLGNPIITISVNDIGQEQVLQNKRNVLRLIISIEQENIRNRNLGLYFFKEIKQNITNEIFPIENGSLMLDNYDPSYISKIYESLTITLVSLALNLNSQLRHAECKAVKLLLSHMPKESVYRDLLNQNPNLSDWLSEQ